jgi:hypothetical protein
MTRPRFAIFYSIAHHCDRDSVIGWSYRLEETATTYGWAAHRAVALNDYDYDHGGDGNFELRVWREDKWGASYQRCYGDPDIAEAQRVERDARLAMLNDDDMPF